MNVFSGLRCTITALVLLPATCTVAQTVAYSDDFETNSSFPQWSTTAGSTAWRNPIGIDSTPIGARRFLGQFGRQAVHLTLNALPPHRSVTVQFDLFLIRSWDGSNRTEGDAFRLSEPNTGFSWCASFSNFDEDLQTYPDTCGSTPGAAMRGATERRTLGYTFRHFGPTNSVYHIRRTFAHTLPVLRLDFVGEMAESDAAAANILNESWGLDNVSVDISEPRIAVTDAGFDTVLCAGAITDTVWVRSTGTVPLFIDSATVVGSAYTRLSPRLPAELLSGGVIPIVVRFAYDTPGTYTGALLIYNNTVPNPLRVDLHSTVLASTPAVAAASVSCGAGEVTIADTCGVGSVALGAESDNVAIETGPPASVVRVLVRLVDPTRQGRCVLLANGVVVHDAIIDATEVLGVPAMAQVVAATGCDTLTVRNRGGQGVWITSARMRRNTAFSAPPSQLPLWIPAGEARSLTVCYQPGVEPEADTLDLETPCQGVSVAFGGGTGATFTGEGFVCGAALGLRQAGAAKPITLARNPVVEHDGSAVTVLVERYSVLDVPEFPVSVAVYDMLGRRISVGAPLRIGETVRNGIREARNLYRASLAACPSGAYILAIDTPEGPALRPFLLVR